MIDGGDAVCPPEMTGQPGSWLSSSKQLRARRELPLSPRTVAPPSRYGTGFLCSFPRHRDSLGAKNRAHSLLENSTRLPINTAISSSSHAPLASSSSHRKELSPCLRVRGSHTDHLPCPSGLGAEGSRSSMCHGRRPRSPRSLVSLSHLHLHPVGSHGAQSHVAPYRPDSRQQPAPRRRPGAEAAGAGTTGRATTGLSFFKCFY